jgi:uncharacterized phiE125 gp8 family phage protein
MPNKTQKTAIEFGDKTVDPVTGETIFCPVTLEEFKLFARIENNEEDSALKSMLDGVTEAAIGYLGRALINQKIMYRFSFFDNPDTLELPYPPLQEVEGIFYWKQQGDTARTEWTGDNYVLMKDGIPGSIQFKTGVIFPTAMYKDYGYEVKYTAGYGTTRDAVPAAIKEAIKIWANTAYANRVITIEPPPEVRASLSLFQVVRW